MPNCEINGGESSAKSEAYPSLRRSGGWVCARRRGERGRGTGPPRAAKRFLTLFLSRAPKLGGLEESSPSDRDSLHEKSQSRIQQNVHSNRDAEANQVTERKIIVYAQQHDAGGPEKKPIGCRQRNALDVNREFDPTTKKNDYWDQGTRDGE
jgi:hypothetical protein